MLHRIPLAGTCDKQKMTRSAFSFAPGYFSFLPGAFSAKLQRIFQSTRFNLEKEIIHHLNEPLSFCLSR